MAFLFVNLFGFLLRSRRGSKDKWTGWTPHLGGASSYSHEALSNPTVWKGVLWILRKETIRGSSLLSPFHWPLNGTTKRAVLWYNKQWSHQQCSVHALQECRWSRRHSAASRLNDTTRSDEANLDSGKIIELMRFPEMILSVSLSIAELRIEPRVMHMLSKCSIAGPYPQPPEINLMIIICPNYLE